MKTRYFILYVSSGGNFRCNTRHRLDEALDRFDYIVTTRPIWLLCFEITLAPPWKIETVKIHGVIP